MKCSLCQKWPVGDNLGTVCICPDCCPKVKTKLDKYTSFLNSRKTQLRQEIQIIKEVLHE